jgi:TatD DNase family protein
VQGLIDTHCHLDLPGFDADRAAVLARARAAGVTTIVVPAIRPATFPRVVALADATPEVRVALGVHPQIVPDLSDDERDLGGLAAALAAARAVAVGECGLDGGTGAHLEQERLFRRQIAIAREARLPLLVHVLHAHDAAPRVLAEERAGDVGGVLHSYSGGPELVARYADLGFAFSFAGPVTYANARRPVAAARVVPAELLLAETDAPDQAPEPHRGGRSEPAFLAHVIAGLARARGATVDEMAALTTSNAVRRLRLAAPPPSSAAP